jgi:hypothetical protein
MNSSIVLPAMVMGTIFFAYVRLFNSVMEAYKKTGYTMTWDEYFRSHTESSAVAPDGGPERRFVPEYESR